MTAELDLAGLKAMLAEATPGPYDISSGLLRAIRGDRAVPMFEVREIWWDPERPAPTVRHFSGKVQFRAGSQAAKIAHAFKMEGRNLRAVHAALSTLPALIQRIEALEEALRPFAEAADAFNDCEQHPNGCPDSAQAGELVDLTVGDFHRARSALTLTKGR
jgi:hypothetical protein